MYLLDKQFNPTPVAVEAKPTLAHFTAWLQTKDPSETYDWMNCHGECLIGQYMASIGKPWYHNSYNTFLDDLGAVGVTLQRIASPIYTPSYPISTFGEALGRARENAARVSA